MIKIKTKKVSIEYVQMKSRDYDNEGNITKNNILSLKPLLLNVQNTPVKDRIWKYSDEIARLQLVRPCTYPKENLFNCKNLWELQFIRIRKDFLPGIAADDGSFDPSLLVQLLNSNQGIGESVSAIYDDDLCVMVLQRNRDGILISGIINYLKNISNDSTIACDIIDLDIDYNKLNEKYICSKLEIGLADLQPETNINTNVKSLINIISGLTATGCTNTTLTLSVGNSKKRSMDSKNAIQSALDLRVDPHTTKLKIYTRETANSKLEEVDLIERRLKDNFSLQYSKEQLITHERVVNNLFLSYNKYRPLLVKKLKR